MAPVYPQAVGPQWKVPMEHSPALQVVPSYKPQTDKTKLAHTLNTVLSRKAPGRAGVRGSVGQSQSDRDTETYVRPWRRPNFTEELVPCKRGWLGERRRKAQRVKMGNRDKGESEWERWRQKEWDSLSTPLCRYYCLIKRAACAKYYSSWDLYLQPM